MLTNNPPILLRQVCAPRGCFEANPPPVLLPWSPSSGGWGVSLESHMHAWAWPKFLGGLYLKLALLRQFDRNRPYSSSPASQFTGGWVSAETLSSVRLPLKIETVFDGTGLNTPASPSYKSMTART